MSLPLSLGSLYSLDAQELEDLVLLEHWNEHRMMDLPKPSYECPLSYTEGLGSMLKSHWWAVLDTKTYKNLSLWSFLSWMVTVPSKLLSGENLV